MAPIWTKGQIVGVVLTCTLVLLTAVALGVWYYRRSQRQRKEHERAERADAICRRLAERRAYEAELERERDVQQLLQHWSTSTELAPL